MPRQQAFDRRQRLGGIVHDVISGAAVDVKINVTRRYHAIAEIGHRNSGGNLPAAPSGNFEDASLLDEQERMLDGVRRSQQPSSSKSQHRKVSIVTELTTVTKIVAALAPSPAGTTARGAGKTVSSIPAPCNQAQELTPVRDTTVPPKASKSPTAECYTV